MTPSEECELTDEYWKRQEYEKAYKLSNEAYAAGYAPACVELGDFHYYGILGERDYSKAVALYKIGAEKGYATAQHALAAVYNTIEHYKDALQWYTRAAEQDEPSACEGLGYLYQNGLGTNVDAAQAIRWYKKGASLGNSNCMMAIGWILYFGELVTKDAHKAREYFETARNASNKRADDALRRINTL